MENIKTSLNFATIVIISTLSAYHFFTYLGRKQFKTEEHNLFFSLTGLFIIHNIIITTWRFNISIELEIIMINIFAFITVAMTILTIKSLLPVSKKMIDIGYITILILTFINVLMSILLLLKSNSFNIIWYTDKARILLLINVIASSIILSITTFKHILSAEKLNISGILIIITLVLYSFNSCVNIFAKMKNIYFLDHNFILLGIFYFFTSIAFSIRSNKEFRSLQEANKNLNSKIFKQNIDLNREKESKNQLLLAIAHELKTPIMLIKNYFEQFVKNSNLENNQDIKIIKNNINKLEIDITNIIDHEILNTGNIIYNHDQIINLSEFLKEKILLFGEYARYNHVCITHRILDNIHIKASPQAIDRILNNIIMNAVKYNKKFGHIIIELEKQEKNVCINITDTGTGIKKEYLNNIFSLYYRENKIVSGLGLGLPIVKKLVDDLNGSIKVESAEGKGSTFEIILENYELKKNDKTVKYSLSNHIEITNYTIQESTYNQAKKTILLVEDEKDLLFLMCDILKTNYNIIHAENGKEALTKISNIENIDVIISDIKMNEMDGYELIKNLPVKYKKVPFIFITAKTTTEEKLKGLKLGAIDYIYKPFNIIELEKKIEKLIELKENEKEQLYKKLDVFIKSNKKTFISFNELCLEYNITKREKEIIRLTAQAKENKEIADILNITVGTVKRHNQNLYNKLEVSNRAELLKKLDLTREV